MHILYVHCAYMHSYITWLCISLNLDIHTVYLWIIWYVCKQMHWHVPIIGPICMYMLYIYMCMCVCNVYESVCKWRRLSKKMQIWGGYRTKVTIWTTFWWSLNYSMCFVLEVMLIRGCFEGSYATRTTANCRNFEIETSFIISCTYVDVFKSFVPFQ